MPRVKNKGVCIKMSPGRRMMCDFLHFAKRVPTIPVAREMNLGLAAEARCKVEGAASWTCIFMKAYALVAVEQSFLRQALLSTPLRIYEHPCSICSIAIERKGEEGPELKLVQVHEPERMSLRRIHQQLQYMKDAPLSMIDHFSRVKWLTRLPMPFRRLMIWLALNHSGHARARRMGTFGLTSYGRLGAEQLHPLWPLSVMLTFGPINTDGRVTVRIVYDHRIMDGSQVARCLGRMEEIINSVLAEEVSK